MKQSRDEKKQASNGVESPSCDEVETRIHDLMDLRLPLLSDKLVREHISDCDQCAELVVDFGALDDSLSQIPIATLQRLSGLQPEESASTSPTRLHPFSFIVSIASILLVVLTSGLWFSGHADPHTDNAVATVPSEDRSEKLYADTSYVSKLPPTQMDLQIAHPGHKVEVPAEFINAVRVVDWQRDVRPYLQMTEDLPGMRPVTRTVNATVLFFSAPLSDRSGIDTESEPQSDPNESPDLGCHGSPQWLLCCV